ncbi:MULTISPECIES: ACT domain-containing protein [Neomoorella]|uniref:Acetolactate synthase 3 regulatory subunit n=1 Tax=Moorella mulderi DSM 14980 TaxID=1122241 RepID=A0A151AWF0_9FIRM|nr:ACT domain-containing protein [Moorella mulderi]KYH31883.1 acetolactate synthase 3 regulatory subunit [Moorella mulderi DSM 14980]
MKIKQLSVFLENKSGRLAAVTRLLAGRGINIRALSIADTSDFGILRLIVNDPEQAYHALKEAGFTVSLTEVLGVEMPDRPGGLSNILSILEEAGINIEYLYAFIGKGDNGALVIFRVEELDKAIAILQRRGITILEGEKIYRL